MSQPVSHDSPEAWQRTHLLIVVTALVGAPVMLGLVTTFIFDPPQDLPIAALGLLVLSVVGTVLIRRMPLRNVPAEGSVEVRADAARAGFSRNLFLGIAVAEWPLLIAFVLAFMTSDVGWYYTVVPGPLISAWLLVPSRRNVSAAVAGVRTSNGPPLTADDVL